MTIVQIVRSPSGGIRKHVMEITHHLIRKGHQLILVTDISTGDESFKQLTNEEWFKNVKVINIPIRRNPHFSDFRNLWELFKYFRTINPQIIHGHGAKGGIYARLLGRRRSVYSPHGGSLHANYGFLKNYLYQLVEKVLLPFTGRVLVESRHTLKQFRKLVSEGFSRVTINFNGVKFPDVCPQRSPLKYQIAALGLLRELKGFDLLIRAAAELKSEYPQLRVQISGEGAERQNLQRLIDGLDAKGIVSLTGEVDSPEKVYEWADVVVVPSRFESFGLVALEAMSQGVPVIVAYTGGLIELVEHGETGRIFTRDSPSDLAEMVRSSFENWNVTEKMADRAFEVAKSKYTREHMFSGVEKVYSPLAKR